MPIRAGLLKETIFLMYILAPFDADNLSAFGGIIALNRTCTQEVAQEISRVFVEIVIAPTFDSKALDILAKKKNLRVLEVGNISSRENKMEVRNVDGGILVQDTDTSTIQLENLKIVHRHKNHLQQN